METQHCFSKCDNIYCQGIKHEIKKGLIEHEENCSVCLENLKDKEIGILSDCNHIFCAECIKKLKENRWEYTCPYCNEESHGAIFTTFDINIDEKQDLFKQHSRCYKNDPNLSMLLDKVTLEWRTFVESLLEEPLFTNVPYDVKSTSHRMDGEIVFCGPRYSCIELNYEQAIRICINYDQQKVGFHVLISNEEMIYEEPDNNYADQVVEWLNEHGIKKSPSLFKNGNGDYVYWRKFSDVHCCLYIAPRDVSNEETCPTSVETFEATNNSPLCSPRAHNFLTDMSVTDPDGISFLLLYLVTIPMDFGYMMGLDETDNIQALGEALMALPKDTIINI